MKNYWASIESLPLHGLDLTIKRKDSLQSCGDGNYIVQGGGGVKFEVDS